MTHIDEVLRVQVAVRARSSSLHEIRTHPPSWLSNWLSEPSADSTRNILLNRAVSNPFAEEVEVQDHSHDKDRLNDPGVPLRGYLSRMRLLARGPLFDTGLVIKPTKSDQH